MNPKKILLVQLKQLGDVLMCTPAIQALQDRFPEAEIHFLTQRPSDQLLAHNPLVRKVHFFPKGKQIRPFLDLKKASQAERFDLVVDFYNKPASAFLSWITGAPIRVGYKKGLRQFFYTHPVTPHSASPYSADERLALLAPLGIPFARYNLRFLPSDQDRRQAKEILEQLDRAPNRPLITLSPVSRQPYKRWDNGSFGWVANKLVEQTQGQVLFVWGPGEKPYVEEVRAALAQPDLGDYRDISLGETVALFELADFHLGNDNGPMHFAIAADCPSLAVFGKPLLENWLPPGSPHHQGVEFDPGCKRNCRYPNCGSECLGADKEAVLAKALEVIEKAWEGGRRKRPTPPEEN
ncbi:MAG: hypothetical protein A2600_06130 [Candidatus Lambdaproteobacteria bacterium RIFOXYD1_FULL_56_27]|uniref:Lipopolysaccharide heptosyltransferase II n=1 Tax=Candidatus Lambdaproteobacteria bacterium RIFOXYD2_FULL_56_26 TaxID=1817773 RepID=A0A1F6GLE7_9PROT|nr:MAG: hypothetical protein A2557_13070 [Candidatus Lambdaproteobacteria bacterium RIFOXYD2_FULL_56_26]OGH05465.1 MAG: hypothetical protein A2426_03700 [Candidatus Lambdaproteobacteria bacterium RIFOXYC1_FULL_56_13]OGH09756.1 MAG: hypothetical protein A2600_06130 [Candidatus Lambdaproteobacteria bacterium RIFOXYD1_FULL_56_27]